jgi:hypothetical protein
MRIAIGWAFRVSTFIRIRTLAYEVAMNITITLQTVKMVVAGASENTSSVAERCAIAGDLLDAISNVPTAYIRSATIVSNNLINADISCTTWLV